MWNRVSCWEEVGWDQKKEKPTFIIYLFCLSMKRMMLYRANLEQENLELRDALHQEQVARQILETQYHQLQHDTWAIIRHINHQKSKPRLIHPARILYSKHYQ